MSDKRLREIGERAQRATEGPWQSQARNRHSIIVWRQGWEGAGAVCDLDRESKYHSFRDNTSNDAQFIAHAREDIPLLLSYIEHLQQRIEELAGEK